jgi:putative transposase
LAWPSREGDAFVVFSLQRDFHFPFGVAQHERWLSSHSFRLWEHRQIEGKIASGNVSQDARGRWSCTIVCQVEPQTTNRTKVVGIDLGFQTVASAHNAPNLDQGSFYRDLEPKLAEAHRRGRQRQVRSIHAKIASRRKDALHK